MKIILAASAVFIAFLIGYIRFLQIKYRYDLACLLKKYAVSLSKNRIEQMLSSYEVLKQINNNTFDGINNISSTSELYDFLSNVGCSNEAIDALKDYNSADISSIDSAEAMMINAFEKQYTEQSKKYNEDGKISLILFPLFALAAVMIIL
jgi:hypothetical protein